MQNRPYLYGELNKSIVQANYEFLPTDTATIYKESGNQVKVDVKKFNIVSIEKSGSADENNLTYKLIPKEEGKVNEAIDLSNVGRWVDLSITDKTDIQPYKINISLKSSENGEIINSKEIDLPIEYSLKSLRYADGNLYYTTQNDDENYVDISPVLQLINVENGTGDYSLTQKEASGKQGQANGRGSVVFGGFRGDEPNDTPNSIPNDDASVNNLDQDAYNDTVSKATGIQSAVFGAGNRAYGDWNFIMGKDSKTCSRAAYIFGGKNYVGDPTNTSKYLYSMAVGSLNSIGSTNSFAAGSQNTVSADYAVSIGYQNSATAQGAMVFGMGSNATGPSAVAFGLNTDSKGNSSFAAGRATSAEADYSATFGLGTYAISGTVPQGAFVIGKFNKKDSTALFQIGNGTSGATADRSNAFEVTIDGYIRLPNYADVSGTTIINYKTFKCVDGVLTAID